MSEKQPTSLISMKTAQRVATARQSTELIAYMCDMAHWLGRIQVMTPYKPDGLKAVKRAVMNMRFPMSITTEQYKAIKAAFTPYKDFPFVYAAYVKARQEDRQAAEHPNNDVFELLLTLSKQN